MSFVLNLVSCFDLVKEITTLQLITIPPHLYRMLIACFFATKTCVGFTLWEYKISKNCLQVFCICHHHLHHHRYFMQQMIHYVSLNFKTKRTHTINFKILNGKACGAFRGPDFHMCHLILCVLAKAMAVWRSYCI